MLDLQIDELATFVFHGEEECDNISKCVLCFSREGRGSSKVGIK